MKNYYYNQKTQDLLIFDTEGNEILVLERLTGIRVFTSSEIRDASGDEPVKHWKNSNWDPKAGKAGYHGEKAGKAHKSPTCKKCGEKGHRSNHCTDGKSGKKVRSGRQWTCKNCGELGHSAKTCKNPPTAGAAPSEKLPDQQIDEIVRVERAAQGQEAKEEAAAI